MDVQEWKSDLIRISQRISVQESMQLALMLELLEEIRGLRSDLAQSSESDPDAEPGPFQTLNGPTIRAKMHPDLLK